MSGYIKWLLTDKNAFYKYKKNLRSNFRSRPRWLNWMRRPTGDQEVAGSTPAEVGNILS